MRLAVPIKFKKLHKNAVIPEYQSDGAACVDLVATEIEYIDENKAIVKFGFASEIPPGYKVILKPRSSFSHKGWVMQNTPGTIDHDYRGEWIAKFEAIPVGLKLNTTTGVPMGFIYEDFPYKIGDRAIQSEVEVNIHMKFIEVEDLSETKRGSGGFGSTGK